MRASEHTQPLDRREVLGALKRLKGGDLSVRISGAHRGLDRQIAEAFNQLAAMNQALVDQICTSKERVCAEGDFEHRAAIPRARGAWKDAVLDLNQLVEGTTKHTQEMVKVAARVADGDFPSAVRTFAGRGAYLEHERTLEAMVDRVRTFTRDVSSFAEDIGDDGQLGRRIDVDDATGVWKRVGTDLNRMAAHWNQQVQEITTVTTSLAQGDLSRKITVDVRGDILGLKHTFNTMVDRLRLISSEVTRVAREVGSEGILGGQADVKDISGVWLELTTSVNSMANNLTNQVRNIADVTTAVAQGDLSKKISVEAKGEIQGLKSTVNTMVDQLSAFAAEVTRVAREVGTEGRLGGQADVKGASGIWLELTDNVNSMADNLTTQVRNIAEVATAIAEGDLSRKITVEVKGEILELKSTINTMVDKLNSFASEVTRVAREVGTEGILGGQANVRGVAGVWKDLTDNVNQMADNLTNQVRDIANVTTAVAEGDLSRKITVEVKGEILTLKNTINTMVDRLSSFGSEVTRVAREVGTEGKLGGQARVRDVAGIWADLTDNVNQMADNLTNQVRNIAEVATSVANGDLTRKITVDAHGEILELKTTINRMVEQLSAFGSEVTRLAKNVGVDGRLGGQAEVPGVGGIWKDLTDNVNSMAANLTSQVRDIAEVTTAVARGDLTRKITVDARGEILELKNTINTMVDQLGSFADEVTRVARQVGTEGKLGDKADVKGLAGTWRDLTDNVNQMATNLTDQVRDIAEVTTAVANGDLSKKVTVEVKGEILKMKETINTMVDQLSSFAEQVTQVAREVGTEGKLGGQADVKGVSGIWRELTDNVNLMAGNLTGQVRNISGVASAIAQGDLTRKITVEARGEILDLKNTINTMVDQLTAFSSEVVRVARAVGIEGRLGGQAEVRGLSGTWRELTDSVNMMASNLTDQVRNISEVATAIARGDLTRTITVDAQGEILELKSTINTMVDQLNSFSEEVTRVAREVGTEGKLGGQAYVRGAAGIWKELTDNVNLMARNLTEQVRGIARVVTAVAMGDLQQKLTLQAHGEIATLADTINDMIGTLNAFADQVTSVARAVGVEGKLGGQAEVPGAAGVWRDLTNNVNELAQNLTNQVRAIGDVATAVTKGDLTRTITVDASGEVAALKDNINDMIQTLRETTRINTEQDWLKTNLTKFSRMLQGQRDLMTVARALLAELAKTVNAQFGAFYLSDRRRQSTELRLLTAYAYSKDQLREERFQLGEGLVGQCAADKQRVLVTGARGDHIKITSGLGASPPLNIVVLPILFEGETKGVIELASFGSFNDIQISFLEELLESVGIVLATIEATLRTEELLKQSQTLTEQLRTQQDALRQTNEELEEKARQLSEQKAEVEAKNREVELARQAHEEKAAQLALTSKYKSEFLANMSHELRTPLNSLLILSRRLADNDEGNLTPKEIEYAQTIHRSGADLLELIDEILDLSKIEAGAMAIDVTSVPIVDVTLDVERGFRQVAEEKSLGFRVVVDPAVPETIETDPKRLQQVLRNLLSNALKFTDDGSVELTVQRAGRDGTILFAVKDTGIGIPKEKHELIFAAFQQAEGGPQRRHGGTGLGLSISREISGLLGGSLTMESEPGVGSTFYLELPIRGPHAERLHENSDARRSKPRLRPEWESSIPDDRREIESGDRTLLIVDGDPSRASGLVAAGRQRGFKCLASSTGETALRLAARFGPSGVVLTDKVLDFDGWVLLEILKQDSTTRHLPIIVSAGVGRRLARAVGATLANGGPDGVIATADKVVGKSGRSLFVLGDGLASHVDPVLHLPSVDVRVLTAEDQALVDLTGTPPDCLVLAPDGDDAWMAEAVGTLERAAHDRNFPVVALAPGAANGDLEAMHSVADVVIAPGERASAHLFEVVTRFLHCAESALSEEHRRLLRLARNADPILGNRTVLVVDDDMRNLFALTSILERHSMRVLFSDNGRDALQKLAAHDEVEIVLMDIMMPEMDGYEAIRRIRSDEARKGLPIIALTARAMMGDREKCIAAGATDYIPKPVDSDRLLAHLRAWLMRSSHG